MDFDKTIPLKFLINLGRREDRRLSVEATLAEVGLLVERFPAIDASRVNPKLVERYGDFRGYETAGRYALALTKRLAIREAKHRAEPAVLLLEDDVIFHANFRAIIKNIEIPDDWQILFLGCAHSLKPEWAMPRVVRVRHAVDNHAIVIRKECYNRAIEVMNRTGKPDIGVAKASDQFIALLADQVPCYAIYPNLAWQAVTNSDLLSKEYSNYTYDGKQKNWLTAVDRLLPEMIGLAGRQEIKLGLLFLTRGDVNHPSIWKEFVSEAPDRVKILSHIKNPCQKDENSFLPGTEIVAHLDTEWGDISLVRATRALLLEALQDDTITHFCLLSESCIPIQPLRQILKKLQLDPRPQFSYKTYDQASLRSRRRASSAPDVPLSCWRFQPQWWVLDRVAAMFAAAEDYTSLFERMFAADEAYFATVLAMQAYPIDGEIVSRASTWTWWETDAGSPTTWAQLPHERLCGIVQSGAMFARKFPPGSEITRFRMHVSP